MKIKFVTLAFNSGRINEMVTFYNALGAGLVETPVRKGGMSYQGALGDIKINFFSIEKKSAFISPNFSMKIEVEDLKLIMDNVRSFNSIQILMDYQDFDWGFQSVIIDPDGHSIELVEPHKD